MSCENSVAFPQAKTNYHTAALGIQAAQSEFNEILKALCFKEM